MGVWVEVSEADFWRMDDLWEVEGREQEPAYACRLATALEEYPEPILGVAAALQTRPSVSVRRFGWLLRRALSSATSSRESRGSASTHSSRQSCTAQRT